MPYYGKEKRKILCCKTRRSKKLEERGLRAAKRSEKERTASDTKPNYSTLGIDAHTHIHTSQQTGRPTLLYVVLRNIQARSISVFFAKALALSLSLAGRDPASGCAPKVALTLRRPESSPCDEAPRIRAAEQPSSRVAIRPVTKQPSIIVTPSPFPFSRLDPALSVRTLSPAPFSCLPTYFSRTFALRAVI